MLASIFRQIYKRRSQYRNITQGEPEVVRGLLAIQVNSEDFIGYISKIAVAVPPASGGTDDDRKRSQEAFVAKHPVRRHS